MWDDQQDKEMARNQMVAIFVMTFLLMTWLYFFSPQPPVEQPPPVQTQTLENPNDPTAPPQPTQIAGDPTAQPAQPAQTIAQPAAGDATGWPNLPAIATDYDPERDNIEIGDEELQLVFTTIGARLISAEVLLEENQGGTINLVPEWSDPDPAKALYPFGLRFTDAAVGDALDYRRWEAQVDTDGNGISFHIEMPGALRVEKHFRLQGRVLDVSVAYVNLESQIRRLGLDVTPAYVVNWGPGVTTGDENSRFPETFVWRVGEENEITATAKIAGTITSAEGRRIPDAEWIAQRGKYFIVALRGTNALQDAWVIGDENISRFGLSARRFELQPGARHVAEMQAYLGPMHINELRDAWATLPTALRFFDSFDIMDTFAKFLLRMLNWFYQYIPNYGVAIILLTIVVRSVMLPLNIRMIANGKAMKSLQPEIEKIREEFKDDQQILGQKMMELYRERGINPVAGCFPMLLQMPIFIALYRMLWSAYELRGANFLWIDDLSQMDCLIELPFLANVPFVGQWISCFNILPILMGVSMFFSMRIMPTGGPTVNPQQKMMMNIMPWMFAVISYGFSAGLNLYVLTSTLIGIAQQLMLNPLIKEPKPKPKRVVEAGKKKKKDFYTRALERQREMEKYQRQAKKKKKSKR